MSDRLPPRSEGTPPDSTYSWLWQQALTGETGLDRLTARLLLLAFHACVIVGAICVFDLVRMLT